MLVLISILELFDNEESQTLLPLVIGNLRVALYTEQLMPHEIEIRF